jgi:hypothetical protein
MQKIIYFIAGDVPTEGEIADIAALNAFANAYSVTVSNGSVAPGLGLDGEGDAFLDAADFVAGAVPDPYEDVPVIDIAAIATVTNGQELTLDGSVYTFTVEGGEITAIDVEPE